MNMKLTEQLQMIDKNGSWTEKPVPSIACQKIGALRFGVVDSLKTRKYTLVYCIGKEVLSVIHLSNVKIIWEGSQQLLDKLQDAKCSEWDSIITHFFSNIKTKTI